MLLLTCSSCYRHLTPSFFYSSSSPITSPYKIYTLPHLHHISSLFIHSPLTALASNMETDLNLKATELRLGLPGTGTEPQSAKLTNKRPLTETCHETTLSNAQQQHLVTSHAAKAKIVGWPPIRSYRKNSLHEIEAGGIYVKVSMDGAPYLRKIDLQLYGGYTQLLQSLENMFKLTIGKYSEKEGYKGSDYAPTYQDKDGDWMLVGDVPWDMFVTSCKRLRIMKGSEARGLACAV
ncbi:hypothetical protein VNO78_20170 [Psophocarpus tetragonolobus]|uniref:Auxin-induced protein n=1 Tax=Psophocarpus tetragonolobus TaxID=3891 RepID=A0AAN9XGV6_PSOTE